jgi:N-acetylglucosaminyldiphosphoundecaprenol N-acetyl-beta-D-mannosaminyltransferase
LDIGITATTFNNAIDTLLAAPRRGEQLRVHFAAMHTIVEASKSEQVQRTLAGADYVMPDGMPLVWLGRLRNQQVERVCGPDTMLAVLDQGRARGYRHFFYGGTPDSLTRLESAMKARFPGLRVAGAYAPPFRSQSGTEEREIADRINAAQPDFVWVGLGSPKQDEWLARFRPLLNAPVLLAVGAAFDFHCGHRQRAPRWAQRAGFEWAFRLAAEPRRLARRYLEMGLCLAKLLLAEFRRPSPNQGPKVAFDEEW